MCTYYVVEHHADHKICLHSRILLVSQGCAINLACTYGDNSTSSLGHRWIVQ